MNSVFDPKIDVVTVCRNAASLVQSTIASVAAQTCPPHSYIVIDGASDDGTQRVIKDNSLHVTHFISETDSGISDAMNKALTFCDGDYVLFLHAGDRLVSDHALAEVTELLRGVQPDILSCPVLLEAPHGAVVFPPRGFGFWMRFKTGIPHQGALCARRLFRVIGRFDPSLKIAMDYDFFLRAYRANASIAYCREPLSYMASGGLSWQRSWPALKLRLAEERRIHLRQCESSMLRFVYAGYWSIYPGYKRAITCIAHHRP